MQIKNHLRGRFPTKNILCGSPIYLRYYASGVNLQSL